MAEITTLDTLSGQVGLVPEEYLDIPDFAWHLVEVPAETKSYEPEKYKPQSADEWRASRKEREAAEKKQADAEAKAEADRVEAEAKKAAADAKADEK